MPNNTYGDDEVPINLHKIRSVNICTSLNSVCNTSLLQGIFSVPLEYSVVKPLHKQGERNCISNYRPVTNCTDCISKILGLGFV
jgi:hypothetical protein